MDLTAILLILLIVFLFAITLLLPLFFFGGGIVALAWGLTRGLSGKESRLSPTAGFPLPSPRFQFPKPEPGPRRWLGWLCTFIACAFFLMVGWEVAQGLVEKIGGATWFAWAAAVLAVLTGALLLLAALAGLFPGGRASFYKMAILNTAHQRLFRKRESEEADFADAGAAAGVPGVITRSESIALWSAAENFGLPELDSMDHAARRAVETRLDLARAAPSPLRALAFTGRDTLGRYLKCSYTFRQTTPVWYLPENHVWRICFHHEWPEATESSLLATLLHRHLPQPRIPLFTLQRGLLGHLREQAAILPAAADPFYPHRRLRAAKQRDGLPATLADLETALFPLDPDFTLDAAAWERHNVATTTAVALAGWLLRNSPDFTGWLKNGFPKTKRSPDAAFRQLFNLDPQQALREALSDCEQELLPEPVPVASGLRQEWRARLLPLIRNRREDPVRAVAAMDLMRLRGHPLAGEVLIEILEAPGDPLYWHAVITLENLFGETGGRSAHYWQGRLDRLACYGSTPATPPPLPGSR